jgi:hypothetical protein
LSQGKQFFGFAGYQYDPVYVVFVVFACDPAHIVVASIQLELVLAVLDFFIANGVTRSLWFLKSLYCVGAGLKHPTLRP